MEPRRGRFLLAPIAEFARQIAYAPPATRRRQMERIERLVGEIDPAIGYPLSFVVFRASGYRSEEDGPLLDGARLRRDLARLVLAISEGLDLAASGRGDEAIAVEDAASIAGVSGRTIHRWRSEGLVVRRVRFPDGERRVAVERSVLERFAASRGVAIGAKRPAARISDAEWRRIEAKFIAWRDESLPPTEAAARVATEFGRSREGVRRRLVAAGLWSRRRSTLPTDRYRRRLLAAFDRLVPPGELARRICRDPRAAEAECRRLRLQRLRGLALPSRRFPTFERADAAKVIPATPLAQRGFRDQWFPLDAVVLLEEIAAVKTPRGFETEAETLLAVEAWLLGEASGKLTGLAPRESSLDEVEWRLRWALAIRRRVARRLLPIVVARIEQALGGPLLSRSVAEIRTLLDRGLRTLADVLDRFEPATRSGPSRSLRGVLSLAVDRAIAPAVESIPSRRAAARHRSVSIEDPSLLLARWASPVLGPDRWRTRIGPPSDEAKSLLERRYGWGDGRPCSLAELAAIERVPLSRVARRLREAHRLVRASRPRSV